MIYVLIYPVVLIGILFAFRYFPRFRKESLEFANEFTPTNCIKRPASKLLFLAFLWPVYLAVFPTLLALGLLFIGLEFVKDFIMKGISMFLFPDNEKEKEATIDGGIKTEDC